MKPNPTEAMDDGRYQPTNSAPPPGGCSGQRACQHAQLGIPETAYVPTLEYHQLPHGCSTHHRRWTTDAADDAADPTPTHHAALHVATSWRTDATSVVVVVASLSHRKLTHSLLSLSLSLPGGVVQPSSAPHLSRQKNGPSSLISGGVLVYGGCVTPGIPAQ
jgi:hypothetical protein